MSQFTKHPTKDDVVVGENGHEYPSRYAPSDNGTVLDQVWDILDTVKPGVIPGEIRAFIAGQFTGLIMKIKAEQK